MHLDEIGKGEENADDVVAHFEARLMVGVEEARQEAHQRLVLDEHFEVRHVNAQLQHHGCASHLGATNACMNE